MTRRARTTKPPAPVVIEARHAPASFVPPTVPWERTWNSPTGTFANVRQTAEMIAAGAYRIPSFQRPFRWDDAAVIHLLDSLLAGYHVGTLLLWERHGSPAVEVSLGGVTIAAPKGNAYLVIDGQQRLGAMAAAFLSGRFHVDLRTGRFTTTPKRGDCPLTALRSGTTMLAWSKSEEAIATLGEWATYFVGTMRDVLLFGPMIHAAILPHDAPIAVVVETFRRLNTAGTPMSTQDLTDALARYEAERGGEETKTP